MATRKTKEKAKSAEKKVAEPYVEEVPFAENKIGDKDTVLRKTYL